PVTFDATQSGLQHLCAMTRADEGRYVNLAINDEQDDFYARVAFRAYRDAPQLMESPFDRELVKQSAMSYFYGSRPGGFAKSADGKWRPYGMTKQIVEELKKRTKEGRPKYQGWTPVDAKKLAHTVYNVIEGMVPRARGVR